MLFTSDWRVDVTKILTKQEIGVVLADLHRKAPRSLNTRMNLAIFRLACCCGLRVSEIAGLQLSDIHIAVARPHLVVRLTVAKCGRGRKVPLWWDDGTLNDIDQWLLTRKILAQASATCSTSLPVFSPLNSLSRVSGNVSSPFTISSRDLSLPATIQPAISRPASA